MKCKESLSSCSLLAAAKIWEVSLCNLPSKEDIRSSTSRILPAIEGARSGEGELLRLFRCELEGMESGERTPDVFVREGVRVQPL